MNKAMIFGAGKIARGFLGQLLFLSNFEITFVDVYQPIVDILNSKKKYHVHVLGDETLDSVVENIFAYISHNRINRVAHRLCALRRYIVGRLHPVCEQAAYKQ